MRMTFDSIMGQPRFSALPQASIDKCREALEKLRAVEMDCDKVVAGGDKLHKIRHVGSVKEIKGFLSDCKRRLDLVQ